MDPYQGSSGNPNYHTYQPVSQPVYNNLQHQQHQSGNAYQVYVPTTSNQQAAYRSFIAPPNNSHKLQEGCYPCYKVILCLYLIGYIIAVMGGIFTAFQDPYLHVLLKGVGIVIYIIPTILIIVQLQAISNRDAAKASQAFCGFIVYVLGYMLYVLSVAAYYGNKQNVNLFVYRNIGVTAAFLIFVVYGSCKVSKILNKNQDF